MEFFPFTEIDPTQMRTVASRGAGKKRWPFMCVSLNNRQLESYPLNVLLSLYSLHPSKLVIPLCTLCTRIYSWILQILALPGNLQFFKSYKSRILFFKISYSKCFHSRSFQNIGLSLGTVDSR